MKMTFKYKGANITKPNIVQGYTEYLPNCWSIMKDLNINAMIVVNGQEGGNEWNINSNPNWAQNLEVFLSDADAHGVKVIFQSLGRAAYPNEVMFGIYDMMDLATAKSMVDKLGGNNALNHNFLTDRRIAYWIVSNEPQLGTGTMASADMPLINWLKAMGDYFLSKGANVAVIGGYAGPTDNEWEAIELFAGHQNIINSHHYHTAVTQAAQNKGQSVYDTLYPYFKADLDLIIAHRGNIPLENIMIGEAGMMHAPAQDGTTLTETSRSEWYRALFQACKDSGVGGVFPFLLFDVINENWGAVGMDGTYFTNVTDQYKAFYITPPLTHSLVITSLPVQGIPITVDSLPYSTPTPPLTLQEGTHTIIAPSNILVGSDIYNFVQWEDGSTNPTRIINLTSNLTMTCTYQLQAPPPPAKGFLEIHAFLDSQEIVAPYEIVGITSGNTPAQIEVNVGNYTVNVTYQGQVKTENPQVAEGQTIRLDFQFGTTPTPPAPMFPVLVGKIIQYPNLAKIYYRIIAIRG